MKLLNAKLKTSLHWWLLLKNWKTNLTKKKIQQKRKSRKWKFNTYKIFKLLNLDKVMEFKMQNNNVLTFKKSLMSLRDTQNTLKLGLKTCLNLKKRQITKYLLFLMRYLNLLRRINRIYWVLIKIDSSHLQVDSE